MSAIRQTLTILKRIAIVVGIAIAFSLGLLGAIYLSLRSSETRVPDIVGKDRTAAENAISDAGLNFRVRAMRATSEAKPDTVLIQLPHAGEIVKVGQTVAVDISRPSQTGETPTQANANSESSNANKEETNSSGNANANVAANKEKKKPANRNGNENGNGNNNRPSNRNLSGNTNRANTNRPNTNGNVNSSPRGNLNANGAPARTNTNRGAGNSNTTRRPVTAPTP